MTATGRRALLIGGSVAVVGGALGALYATGHLPIGSSQPPAGTPLIVAWPKDLTDAKAAAINLDVLWWQYWQANGQTTTAAYQNQLNQEASAIRAAYAGAAPAGGYTCTQLKAMGKLPSTFTCPAYENAGAAEMAGAAFVRGSFLPARAPGLLQPA